MSVRILQGHVLDVLKTLPDQSVQGICTSPPYFQLRAYGTAPQVWPDGWRGELGQEPTPALYVAHLVDVFREARRVLRDDGVLLLNIGDSYAGSGKGPSGGTSLTGAAQEDRQGFANRRTLVDGLKAKDLIGIPWRVAFALQDDGYYLRGDYIWHKPACMPESVTDRCTRAHEYVFHLTKSARYFWNQDELREPSVYDGPPKPGRQATITSLGGIDSMALGVGNVLGANRRSVWTISPGGFAEAHFATFPPALAEIMVKAVSRPGDTVLDVFGGAGTLALAADRLGRDAISIELNPTYVAMQERRLTNDAPLLVDLEVA